MVPTEDARRELRKLHEGWLQNFNLLESLNQNG
jgi:hypothetical protein